MSGNVVYQLDKDKVIIAEYPSYLAATRSITNSNTRSNTAIKECCIGKRISCYGYYWCLAENYNTFKPKGEITTKRGAK